MMKFTDPRLYLKGTSSVICKDVATGDITYFSNKFQTGNITTGNTMGEIRAGWRKAELQCACHHLPECDCRSRNNKH